MNKAKGLYKIILLGLLIYSCGTLPKHKKKILYDIDRVGIMDTITVNISGNGMELYDKFGLKGASIELVNKENSYSRTCNEKGEFDFKHISAGKYLIIADFVGYYMLRDSIELKTGEMVKLKIGLGYDE